MGKKPKTLQTLVCEALNTLTLHLSVNPFSVTLNVVPPGDEKAPLVQQVVRFDADTGRIIVPGNQVKNVFPDYSEKDAYAEHTKQFKIGALAGIPLFYQNNPLVKPLLDNHRVQEYSFWSWMTTGYCGFVQELHTLGEKETMRHANKVLNNVHNSQDFGTIGLDYATQLMLRFGPKALREVMGYSTTTEIHDLVKPREFLSRQYMRKQNKPSK